MKYTAVIIGSGAAGLNAAYSLCLLGVKNIAIITEGLKYGTTYNSGSDKQTYYRLDTCSRDSIYDVAQTLYKGGTEGSQAMIEAAYSLPMFYRLVSLGLNFPKDKYGRYIGYRTDGDERKRGTSLGPWTSRMMWNALYNAVLPYSIPIIEGRAVRLMTDTGGVCGVKVKTKAGALDIYSENVIMATGGAASVYGKSVYPKTQTGGIGIALDAGARAVDLDRRQFGIAAIDALWNLSGTYQQAIPRYVTDEGEFLDKYGIDTVNRVFQKGYNWPFDSEKPSSEVDRAVLDLTAKGTSVYLDYTQNPKGYSTSAMDGETREYLQSAGAIEGRTPFERLNIMNPAAVALLREKNIDPERELIRIDVLLQHFNGGLLTDCNYMTEVEGLYAAGECCGAFGKSRPGGSALNNAMVSSQRAAEHIAGKYGRNISPKPYGISLEEPEDINKIRLGMDKFFTPANCNGEEKSEFVSYLEKARGGPVFEDIRLTALALALSEDKRRTAPKGHRVRVSVANGSYTSDTARPLPPEEKEENFELLLKG